MYELKQISINYQYHVFICLFVCQGMGSWYKIGLNYALIQSLSTNVQIEIT